MPSLKRPYHHGDLHAALLKAAEAMLERAGADALSMRELSRQAGVSNNAPRRHFPSKRALLDTLALKGFERLGDALQRALHGHEPRFEKRILKLARANIRFALKHPALTRLMFAAKQRPDAPADLLAASYRALSAGPDTILFGQRSGHVAAGDPELLALTVFAAVEGLISLSVDGKFGGVPLARLAERVLAVILQGLHPRT